MKHIYLNLKRFDVPAALGGVERNNAPLDWAERILRASAEPLRACTDAEFVDFFPEAHLIPALNANPSPSPVRIGCQSVYREDVRPGGNFGAFTTLRPAAAMRALGIRDALIGHCEERRDLNGILAEAGVRDSGAVNRLLNREVLRAQEAGMKVLFCVGETAEERSDSRRVLTAQLREGLNGADLKNVVIAYEPVWSIGPGKTPADPDTIAAAAGLCRELTGADVVYGGGLKRENAAQIAGVRELSGGLIALTRFSGEIGFYPEEYLEIVRLYLEETR